MLNPHQTVIHQMSIHGFEHRNINILRNGLRLRERKYRIITATTLTRVPVIISSIFVSFKMNST